MSEAVPTDTVQVDSDEEFFTIQTRVSRNPHSAIAPRSSAPRRQRKRLGEGGRLNDYDGDRDRQVEEEEEEDEDEDRVESGATSRQATRLGAKFRPLPAWVSEPPGGLRTTKRYKGDSEGHNVIGLGTSADEEDTICARKTRERITLTPPPPLPEAKKLEIARLREQFFPSSQGDRTRSLSPPPRSVSPAPPPISLKTVLIHVKMVADPEKMVKGASAAAIRQYERLRTFTIGLDDKLDIVVAALAKRIQKPPQDIALIFRNHKLYTGMTPAKLQIDTSADMQGYETHVWEKLKEERRQRGDRVTRPCTRAQPDDGGVLELDIKPDIAMLQHDP